MHALDEAFAAAEPAVGADRFRQLYQRTPALRQALRSRWSQYARETTDLSVLEALIALRDELFGDDAMTSGGAAGALERTGGWQKIVDSFPNERLEQAVALFALGRTSEVLQRFSDVPFLRDEALMRLGRIDELRPTDDLYCDALLLLDEVEEGLRRFPDDPDLLLAGGRPEDVLARSSDKMYRAMALRRLGRLDEAMALGDVASLLYGDRVDEALERAKVLDQGYMAWAYRTLAAYVAGDRDKWQKSRERLDAMPFSWRWHGAWPSKFLVMPFIARLEGDSDAVQRACRDLASMPEVYFQVPSYFARLVLGEITPEQFDAQPQRFGRDARKTIALGVRSELENRPDEALGHYRRYVAEPIERRRLDTDTDDPVVDRFVAWRASALNR